LLLPANCLVCSAELNPTHDRIGFCDDCRSQLSADTHPVCRRCASRVPAIPGEVSECPRCRDHKLWFDQALTLGSYKGLLRDQLLLMKTDRSERLAPALGHWMANQLRDKLRHLQPDAIVPVPMHPWRRLSRGTNSPAALATVLGQKLGLPTFPKILLRRRNIQPQLGLSQSARFQNVRGQMRVRAGYHLEAPHVLLVDDILTTGATCSEAAKMLKRAGAEQVTVLVAARTPAE